MISSVIAIILALLLVARDVVARRRERRLLDELDRLRLQLKESDRLAALEQLRTLGVSLDVHADGLVIEGGAGRRLRSARIDAHGDHRIAMAFAIASLYADAPILIRDVENVGTSFPRFVQTARGCGLELDESGS